MDSFIEKCTKATIIIGLPIVLFLFFYGAATGDVTKILSVYPLLYLLVNIVKASVQLQTLAAQLTRNIFKNKKTVKDAIPAGRNAPPQLAEWLVKLSMPESVSESCLGDLQEEWFRISSEETKIRADLWYWWQTCNCLANAAKDLLHLKFKRF